MPVTLIKIYLQNRRYSHWLFLLLGLLVSSSVNALPLIPMTYQGNIGYSYSYSKADEAESETATLSGTVSGAGFIWQPWFVTVGVGISLGVSESNSNTGGSGTASTVASGNVQFTVFPQSRFPSVLSFSRTDSRLENTSSAFSSDNHYVNTRMFFSQTYYGKTGYIARFSWDHSKFESERTDSSNDSLSASFRGKQKKHRYSANAGFTKSERSTSEYKPSTSRLEAQHNYIPSTELGVSSMASYTRNDSGQNGSQAIFENIQASSVFGWRPVDRPYTISGGARISTSDSGSGLESKSMSTNIGASYRFTRSLRLITTALISASESSGTQSVSTSESANLNYYSQQYFIGGFSWSWNSALGFSNANNKIDDTTDSQQNASLSLSHNFNRNWAVGRTSTVNFAFTENGNVSKSSEVDKAVLGIGHGLGLGWSRRGISSGSFANLSISDSRTSGEQKTTFQQLSAQLTQRNVLSRVSALSANVVYQMTRQELPDNSDESQPETLTGNISYTNSRAFGIYALRFSTRLAYNKRLDNATNATQSTESDSRLDYRVGLLTTSLTYRIMQVEGGTMSENINFTLTRTF